MILYLKFEITVDLLYVKEGTRETFEHFDHNGETARLGISSS